MNRRAQKQHRTDLFYTRFITETALQNSKNGMDFQKKALGQ